jgi:ABC-type Fe3+-siderophore transport system permease subunit
MQRIIGAGLGAVVTYVLLVILAGAAQSQVYLTAVLVGLIVSIAWPWIISLMVARGVRERRREEADRELEEQQAHKSGGG